MADQTRISLNELISKLRDDETFRQELLTQPATALETAGYALQSTTSEVSGYRMCSITCNRPTCEVTCESTEA